jgi:Fe-S-cluster containining protein
MSGIKKNSKELMDKQQKELRESLEATKRVSLDDLASQIKTIGFECLCCGDCCVGEDNSVVLFPFEIRKILAATGVGWLDAVEPPEIGEWDSQGNFHTLEWRIEKDGESCKFYSETGCKIYQARPMMCKTYPFYLDGGKLRCSECQGLGKDIGSDEAKRIATLVINRSLTEIQEAIALLKRYTDFERGSPTKSRACIVHDSEGEHPITWDGVKDNCSSTRRPNCL